MQFLHHSRRVGKAAGMEAPDAVILLPGIVDHQHAGRVAVGKQRMGIVEHGLPVVVIAQLHPGVELGRDVECALRAAAVKGKMRLHAAEIPFPQGCAVLFQQDGRAALGAENPMVKGNRKGLLAPDRAAVAGDEERRALVAAPLAPQVDGIDAVRAQRHLCAVVHRAAPPKFPFLHLRHQGAAHPNLPPFFCRNSGVFSDKPILPSRSAPHKPKRNNRKFQLF